MPTPKWLNRVVIDAIHLDQLREHGGLRGMRNEPALTAALESPKTRWEEEDKPDLARLASSYGHDIATDRPYLVEGAAEGDDAEAADPGRLEREFARVLARRRDDHLHAPAGHLARAGRLRPVDEGDDDVQPATNSSRAIHFPRNHAGHSRLGTCSRRPQSRTRTNGQPAQKMLPAARSAITRRPR